MQSANSAKTSRRHGPQRLQNGGAADEGKPTIPATEFTRLSGAQKHPFGYPKPLKNHPLGQHPLQEGLQQQHVQIMRACEHHCPICLYRHATACPKP